MVCANKEISDVARRTFEQKEGAPLFLGDWVSAAFVHFEVDPVILQRNVPYKLDLREGKAYVSLVAFTMQRLRPRFGGRLSAAAFAPIAAHSFLNVRTYVEHNRERGIYFLMEWVSNPIAVLLGPATFGLPYRYGKLDYRHDQNDGITDSIRCRNDCLKFSAETIAQHGFAECPPASLDEWLIERYIAFTRRGRTQMYFRVWHEPWPQIRIRVRIGDDSLLRSACSWYPASCPKVAGGNFSDGVRDVWIGWPRGVAGLAQVRAKAREVCCLAAN